MTRPPVVSIAGLGCLGLGLIFAIVGLATTGWIVFTAANPNTNFGLFKVCAHSVCYKYDDLANAGFLNLSETSTFLTTQVLLIIGVIITALAGITGIVAVIMPNSKPLNSRALPGFMMIFSIVGGILIIAAPINFAVDFGEDILVSSAYFHYDYSFALTIVGSIFIFIGGVIYFLGMRRFVVYGQAGQVVTMTAVTATGQPYLFQMQPSNAYGPTQQWQQQPPQAQQPQRPQQLQYLYPTAQYTPPAYEGLEKGQYTPQ